MSEPFPEVPLDLPAQYRITVTGILVSSWVERYWGMTSTVVEQRDEPDQTALVGEVADQAALIGVINALYNKGHTVVSVERIHPDTDPHPVGTEEET
jgi:hypothetical protein